METTIAAASDAPSAPAATVPASPVAVPAAAAPSANASAALPTTEAQMIAFASNSLAADPANEASPAAAESPAATTTQTPPTPNQTSDDLAEISPEVLATLGDAGKRALQAERAERKEAKTQLAQATAEIERLKSLVPNADANAPSAMTEAPAETAATPTPSVPVAPELANCKNALEVDAFVLRATQEQGLAMELNTVLATEGINAVLERFQAINLEKFRGIPLNDLTPAILARELSQTFQRAEEIKLAAPQQKQAITEVRANMLEAVNLLPGLKDPNSAVRREFNALATNPAVVALGPSWPLLVAQTLRGRQAVAQAQTPAQPAPLSATPMAATVPAPGAPRLSVQTPAHATAFDDAAGRLVNGTATEKDMAALAAGSLRAGMPYGGKK